MINTDKVSPEYTESNLLDSYDDVKSPSLQSFDVFCEATNIIEQDASVFSLEDMSDRNLILVSGEMVL